MLSVALFSSLSGRSILWLIKRKKTRIKKRMSKAKIQVIVNIFVFVIFSITPGGSESLDNVSLRLQMMREAVINRDKEERAIICRSILGTRPILSLLNILFISLIQNLKSKI